jgi:hypothetical protein
LRPRNMNRLFIGSPDKTNFILQSLDFTRGVTLIDPTGALAPAAANIVPIGRTQRTLYLDPSDMAHPVGLNVLEGVAPDDRQPLTEQLCSYFEAMWPSGWGAQSNFILANCLRVLLDTQGATLLGVLKLLTDRSYRDTCIANCTDPVVLANWRVINRWDTKQSQAAIAPLQNKIGTLLMSPTIRNIVGQKRSTLTGADIIIANLDRAKLGSLTARLLGGLLIARCGGDIYINDFGFFASDYVASLLPQNRFSVSLSFLDELPRKLQAAVLTIEEKLVLKINPRDAEELAFYVGLMNPRILTELAPEEARTTTGLFEAAPPPSLRRLRPIRRHSRACHTRPRQKVEENIKAYFANDLKLR